MSEKMISVGDTVQFGSYQKYADKEPIDWRVLDVQDGKALLITVYGIDRAWYQEEAPREVTWESCTLRKWMNSEFLATAFTAEEAEKILLTTVSPDKNPQYATDPGAATQDKVFLLSVNEANRYFPKNKDRISQPTSYAKRRGAFIADGNCYWTLRTPGKEPYYVCYVVNDGSISLWGEGTTKGGNAMRPAIWVQLPIENKE